MKNALIITTIGGFVPQFEMNDVKILQEYGYTIHYASDFENPVYSIDYEELEKEGLIRSVAGKGFYVCEYNQDYLKEKQLMMLEKRLSEVIEECKNAGLSKEEIMEMIQALFVG